VFTDYDFGLDCALKGEVPTRRELGKRTGFNENYVSRILDLAVLSLEITDATFRGDHEASLTVAQLIANLEIDWTLFHGYLFPAKNSCREHRENENRQCHR
jgi:hypothetical protein